MSSDPGPGAASLLMGPILTQLMQQCPELCARVMSTEYLAPQCETDTCPCGHSWEHVLVNEASTMLYPDPHAGCKHSFLSCDAQLATQIAPLYMTALSMVCSTSPIQYVPPYARCMLMPISVCVTGRR